MTDSEKVLNTIASSEDEGAIAEALYECFEVAERDTGEKFYRVRQELSEEVRELLQTICRGAHEAAGGEMPNDQAYEVINDTLYAAGPGRHERDAWHAIEMEVDPPIYTHDLYTWLTSYLSRKGFVDEAMEETHYINVSDAIRAGWAAWASEITYAVYARLMELADYSEIRER
jgi:hypothetical protein